MKHVIWRKYPESTEGVGVLQAYWRALFIARPFDRSY